MCRKYICYKLDNKKLDMNKEIENFLGKTKYSIQENYDNVIGNVNVLSYHPLGGELIKVETISYPGSGNITCTGLLGEVIKESIELSFAYIKSHVKDFKLSFEDLVHNDYFVHLTNAAIKKDGPSAGVSITTSILSLLKKKKISKNISMSGELSLSGKILRVGGIKEKIILALKSDINKIYLPLENKNDVLELRDLYNDKIEIVFVDNYMDIYQDLFKK